MDSELLAEVPVKQSPNGWHDFHRRWAVHFHNFTASADHTTIAFAGGEDSCGCVTIDDVRLRQW